MANLRSYRFSRNTQAILARLTKKTGKTQNIVALRAFKLYEESLEAMKPKVTAPEWIDGHNKQEVINQNYLNPSN